MQNVTEASTAALTQLVNKGRYAAGVRFRHMAVQATRLDFNPQRTVFRVEALSASVVGRLLDNLDRSFNDAGQAVAYTDSLAAILEATTCTEWRARLAAGVADQCRKATGEVDARQRVNAYLERQQAFLSMDGSPQAGDKTAVLAKVRGLLESAAERAAGDSLAARVRQTMRASGALVPAGVS